MKFKLTPPHRPILIQAFINAQSILSSIHCVHLSTVLRESYLCVALCCVPKEEVV
jgi:hypothetical protein